ncbi:MAG: C40 family peptidase [Cardiobacteriaceae bacterium]|nr:C40 family peptidase [Cardiobacteriaceae bacterium]
MKKEILLCLMLVLAGCSTTQEIATINTGITLESLKADEPPVPPKKSIPATENTRTRLIANGKKFIGVPYHYGGTGKNGFDCSGLVQRVFAEQGFRLPRSSSAQFQALLPVKEPKPGDLVFFRRNRGGVNHVGIYLGNKRMLHAPSTGKSVEIVRIDQGYWQKRYAGARAVVQDRATVSR